MHHITTPSMPPSFVTCYVCGREFGTRSIGIHVPKCLDKWETQQEKLPKAERRERPSPPENYDRILSGELTGKELIKVNQKAAEDYKKEVLQPCSVCGRTFLPEALLRHQNACREDRPMSKQKGESYTAKMKNRVNYPKLKTNKTTTRSKENTQHHSPQETESIRSVPQSPSLIRKETITISKPSQPNEVSVEESISQKGVTAAQPSAQSSSINRKDTVILSRRTTDDKEGTLETLEDEDKLPSKDDFIKLLETEAIFDSQKHRRAILDMVTQYARNVRRSQILEILDHEVLEDVGNLEEVMTMLTEYVRSKTNNNQH